MPEEIPDVSKLPALLQALKDAEYSSENIEKFAYKNWLRVIVEDVQKCADSSIPSNDINLA